MALSIMLSRSSVLPSGIRVIACAVTAAAPSTAVVVNRPRYFSSSGNKTLEKSQTVIPRAPAGLPFTIADDHGEKLMKLTRQFHDETITIEIETKSDDDKDGSDYDDSSSDDDDDSNDDSTSDDSNDESDDEEDDHIPMTVTIEKSQGKALKVELLADVDDIEVTQMSIAEVNNKGKRVEYPGPAFEELDEFDQNSLFKYLDIRGINSGSVKLLQEYLAEKSQVDDKASWIKKLKQFMIGA